MIRFLKFIIGIAFSIVIVTSCGRMAQVELVDDTVENSANQSIPFDKPPEPLTPITPDYSRLAEIRQIEGKVIVDFFVNEYGDETEIHVFKGLPGSGLDQAAVDAVIETKFIPASLKGIPTGVWVRQSVKFALMDQQPG